MHPVRKERLRASTSLGSLARFGDGLDQIASVPHGPHPQAEGAQPGGEAPNRPANRAQDDLPHLTQLPASLIEREREQVCQQRLIGAVVRVGLEQWDEDAHPIGGKLLHRDDIGLTRRGLGEQDDRSRGGVDDKLLVVGQQTSEWQMQQQVWLVFRLMAAIGGWTHRHTRGSHSGDCTRAKTQRGTPTPFLYILYDVNERSLGRYQTTRKRVVMAGTEPDTTSVLSQTQRGENRTTVRMCLFRSLVHRPRVRCRS